MPRGVYPRKNKKSESAANGSNQSPAKMVSPVKAAGATKTASAPRAVRRGTRSASSTFGRRSRSTANASGASSRSTHHEDITFLTNNLATLAQARGTMGTNSTINPRIEALMLGNVKRIETLMDTAFPAPVPVVQAQAPQAAPVAPAPVPFNPQPQTYGSTPQATT